MRKTLPTKEESAGMKPRNHAGLERFRARDSRTPALKNAPSKEKGEAMKSRPALLWGAIAFLPLAACAAASALAGTPAPAAAPMAKPPAAASGATSASNPDNMPMKKPKGPTTDDQMMRSAPASAARAK